MHYTAKMRRNRGGKSRHFYNILQFDLRKSQIRRELFWGKAVVGGYELVFSEKNQKF